MMFSPQVADKAFELDGLLGFFLRHYIFLHLHASESCGALPQLLEAKIRQAHSGSVWHSNVIRFLYWDTTLQKILQ